MLSMKFIDKDSVAIALFSAYHKKNSGFLYYNKNGGGNQNYSVEDRDYLLELQYGKDKARYEKNRKLLKLSPKFSIVRAPHKGGFLPFYPMNAEGERVVHYIAGKSGSGKSYMAKMLSHMYTKMKMNTFLVSPVPDSSYSGTHVDVNDLVVVDDSTDYEQKLKKYQKAKIKLRYQKKILTPDEIMKLEMMIIDMKPKKGKNHKVYKFTEEYYRLIKMPSLWIYDDTEASADQAKLHFIQNSQLLTGRHDNITMVIINHQSNAGNRTRDVINESHTYTCFQPMNRYTDYFLKTYMSFSRKQIKAVEKILDKSRFCTIYRDYNVILGTHVAYSV